MERSEKRTPLGYLWLYVVGIIVGAATVIPGVSGGTVMVVLGVYERIIGIITSFVKKIKEQRKNDSKTSKMN